MIYRLKDDWKADPQNLIAKRLAEDLNHAAKWWNSLAIRGGIVEKDEQKAVIYPSLYGQDAVSGGSGGDFVWNVTGTGLEITITPGEIELGPDTVIAWGSITGATATINATTGDSYLYIWVNVDVLNETAEMLSSATSITALSSTEKKTILQKKIAKVTFVADAVTTIARYQCGNIFIPRL